MGVVLRLQSVMASDTCQQRVHSSSEIPRRENRSATAGWKRKRRSVRLRSCTDRRCAAGIISGLDDPILTSPASLRATSNRTDHTLMA